MQHRERANDTHTEDIMRHIGEGFAIIHNERVYAYAGSVVYACEGSTVHSNPGSTVNSDIEFA